MKCTNSIHPTTTLAMQHASQNLYLFSQVLNGVDVADPSKHRGMLLCEIINHHSS